MRAESVKPRTHRIIYRALEQELVPRAMHIGSNLPITDRDPPLIIALHGQEYQVPNNSYAESLAKISNVDELSVLRSN